LKSLSGLNPEQLRAVEYVGGPELIFAGAGSGKTKVLAHKVAYLIENKVVAPQNILAVTFTNKAAQELRARVGTYVGKKAAFVNVGTFHAICARLLRREIGHLGYSPTFTIYDEHDQLSLVKKVISEASVVLNGVTPKTIHSRISYLKNHLLTPEEFAPRPGVPADKLVKFIYPLYQQALVRADALDFDDLLILPLRIFNEQPKVLAKYRLIYQYVLVDEYQDTNRPQFLFIQALGGQHRQVCVVGDDDQSIYSWRGADIKNILNFSTVFPECRTFYLEQNYRSTNNILKAASAVVGHNKMRAKKTLWSEKSGGELLIRLAAETEYDEAALIASQIRREIVQHKRNFKDFAILYRTNAQTRVLEEILRRNDIVYMIVGGLRFYERKEIKDLLAYFQFIANPKDDISLRRIINLPPRGIGKTTLETLEQLAREKALPLFEAIKIISATNLSSRASQAVENFYQQIVELQNLRKKMAFGEWSRVLIVSIGIRQFYKDNPGEESLERLANIDELLNDITEYCQSTDQPSLEEYLEKVTLLTAVDEWEETRNAVSLMTLHSAKGLEFPIVFICGLNQGLLPLERDPTPAALEEERRLFYVGLTRAREKVFLASSQRRVQAGEINYSNESLFFREIPPELLTNLAFTENVMQARRPKITSAGSKARQVVRQTSTPGSPSDKEALSVGAGVAHKIFGRGTVLAIEGVGAGARVTVNFRSCGRKTIVARFLQTD